jgi:hypothetical protein
MLYRLRSCGQCCGKKGTTEKRGRANLGLAYPANRTGRERGSRVFVANVALHRHQGAFRPRDSNV